MFFATPPTWAEITATAGAAELLTRVRALLAHEAADGTVTLLPELPAAWRGHGVDVRDAPTRAGPVSYSVRWHGDRPALLWEVPPGVPLRAPGLDPGWTTRDPMCSSSTTSRRRRHANVLPRHATSSYACTARPAGSPPRRGISGARRTRARRRCGPTSSGLP